MIPREMLAKHGITVTLDGPGEYPTICPQCSPQRKKNDKKDLNVALKEEGSVTWYCHHCGWKRPEKGSGTKKGIVPSHIYRDRDGIIRFGKVRNPPGAKIKCWFCHPDGGVWTKGLAKNTNTKILYRADEIAEAIEAGRTICVAEGERDCDNLWRIGIPATCNAHGASDDSKKPKWYVAHSEQLRGADLIVLNDNDPPGYAHADAVCRLSHGVAKRVRRLDLKVDWPDIPPKGDVSDWFAVGGEHTAEKLKALIEAAPLYAVGNKAEADAGKAASDESPPSDDDAELERLAKLDPLSYGRARKEAAKRLGGIAVSLLDAAVRDKRAELGLDADDGRQGRQFEFARIEPWSSVVDGAALLDEITDAIRRHVIMLPHAAEAIALWVVHTHLVERFLISPRLAVRSVTKQCGKTTTLDIMARLVHRPLPTVNVTAAAIFRVVEAHRPCLLVDEADTFLKDNEELRGIINSGHRQGGCVLRVEGDQHETRAFATYAPCAIAAIGSLPGTIMDRSVVIDLARRKPDEKIEAFRLDRTAALDEIARRIVRWGKDNADAIAALDPDVPPGIYNRAADNWRPLFQIADVAGGDWPQRARGAALSGAPDIDEVSRLELLLGDLRDVFDAMPGDLADPKAKRISSAELIEKLCEIEPRPWSEYGRSGKPITQNQLARVLKPLGIAPVLMRITTEAGTEERARGYALHQFAEAFERYLPSEGVSNRDSVTNADNTGTSGASPTVTAKKPVTVPKDEKSNNDGVCHGVTVGKGDTEDKGPSRAVGPPAVGLSVATFRALINTYQSMVEDSATVDLERVNASFRKRLAGHGLSPGEIEIALAYIIEQAKPGHTDTLKAGNGRDGGTGHRADRLGTRPGC